MSSSLDAIIGRLRAFRDRVPAWLRRTALAAVCLLALFLIVFCILPRLLAYAGEEALRGIEYSRVALDASGAELQVLPLNNGLRRLYRGPEQVPDALRDIVIRSEDARFRLHPGVDFLALVRAVFQNLRAGGTVSGASTISMQAARLLLPRGRSWKSKAAEAWEAMQLESRLGKEAVLDLYLNLLPFGHNAEGFGAAARIFFGRELSDLGTAELAVLAVVPRAPLRYDPFVHPEDVKPMAVALLERSGRMSGDHAAAVDEALAAVLDPSRPGIWPFRAPHYIVWLSERPEWKAWDSRKPFPTGIEPRLQSWLEDLLSRTVEEARRKRVSNAAALFVRPGDMRIAAWVGSVDFHDEAGSGQTDGVRIHRQPGSALKPFLYSLALGRGFRASTVLPDVPTDFGGEEVYVPANFNNQFNGPVRLRQALASSLNVPAVHTLQRLGVQPFVDLLLADGFDSLAEQRGWMGLGLALGNAEVSLFELVRGYGVFLNEGTPVRLNASPGMAVEDPEARPIIDPRVAMLVRDILIRHPDRTLAFGRGGNTRLRFEGAIKTGTSDQFNNIWAVGFTSDLLGGVWMGNFSGATVVGTADSGYPAGIISATLESFSAHEAFPPVRGLERAAICSLSGLLATKDCPHTMEEWFLPGTEPGPCDWHRKSARGISTVYPQEYQNWLSRYRYSVAEISTDAELEIASPLNGAQYFIDPAKGADEQGFSARATGTGRGSLLLDGVTIQRGIFPLKAWVKLQRGSHRLEVRQDTGDVPAEAVTFDVK